MKSVFIYMDQEVFDESKVGETKMNTFSSAPTSPRVLNETVAIFLMISRVHMNFFFDIQS